MTEGVSQRYSLRLIEEEIKTIEKALQIIMNRDPMARVADSPSAYIQRSLDKTKEYFSSRVDYHIALLSLSLGQSSSPLGKISGERDCENNCAAACTITCVNVCKNSCEGGCVGNCHGGCEGSCKNTCEGSCRGSCDGVFR